MRKIVILLTILLLLGAVVCTYFVYTQSRLGHDRLLEHTEVASGNAEADTLVVLLHAFSKSGDSLSDVESVIRDHYEPDSIDILKPNLPLGALSLASHARITAELVAAVDQAWENKAKTGQAYRRILLVGHSFGALFARKLYVVANGESALSPFEPEINLALKELDSDSADRPRAWAEAVERIVLMAGMNRGWSISHHMSITRAIYLQLGVGLGYTIELFTGRLPVIMSIRRGAPFITQLRLQWLEMERAIASDPTRNGAAITVQLLGTVDDLVAPDDNIDLVSGKNFIYDEMPASGHGNVVDLIDPDSPDKASARRAVFKKSLVMRQQSESSIGDLLMGPESDETVTDVVFVIHGIRDLGYWTKRIARRVQILAKESGEKRKIATETSSYGYFPMLSFLVPGARQEKVEWLMDRYTEARARYPNARFHYVGHSHGTYLLAKALEDYQSVRFDHVVFAGSVVKQQYEWQDYIPHRIRKIHNFVANGDWVVAFFPKTLQTLHVQDLGSAGHDGFIAANTGIGVSQPEKLVVGGHSAALQERLWDLTASFILTGDPGDPEVGLMTETHKWWVEWAAEEMPLIWAVIILVCILYALFRLNIREWKKTLVIVGYLAFVWVVVTRV